MLRSSIGVAFCLVVQTSLLAADTPAKSQPATSQPAPAAKSAHTPTKAVVQLRTDAPVTYPVTAYPVATVPATLPAPKPAAATTSRKQLEASLQTVANLDYGDRKTVTVKEVLDDLHHQHHLSIRFDMPTLSSLFGIEPMSGMGEDEDESTPHPPAPIADPSTHLEKAPSANSTASLCEPTPLEVVPEAAPEIKAPSAPASENQDNPAHVLDMLMKAEVKIEHVDLKNVTIATVLRHTCDALPVMSGLDDGTGGIPIKLTNASLIDYVVEDDGLLITTRMYAMTVKETRVYSLKKLKGVSPDELAKVIRQSIRPWSWRSQINDLGEQLKSGMPSQLPAEVTSSILNTGLQLMSGASSIMGESECTECIMPLPIATTPAPVTAYLPPGFSTATAAVPTYSNQPAIMPPPLPANAILNVVPSNIAQPSITISATAEPAPPTIPAPAFVPPPSSSSPYLPAPTPPTVSMAMPINPVQNNSTASSEANAATIGINALVNALVTFAHASLSAVEMVHYAEPPTGTIQTLPGKLIVTQSQAAHREIADLLEQLEEE